MLSVAVHIRWLGVLWAAIIRYNSSAECSAWYACSVCSHSSWSYWGHFVLINSLLNSVEHGVINIKSICLCKVAITSLWIRGFLVCVLVFFVCGGFLGTSFSERSAALSSITHLLLTSFFTYLVVHLVIYFLVMHEDMLKASCAKTKISRRSFLSSCLMLM